MSQGWGPGFCEKAMWGAYGGDAGCCNEPAFGEAAKGTEWAWLLWACRRHGGPRGCCDTPSTVRSDQPTICEACQALRWVDGNHVEIRIAHPVPR